MSVQNLCDSLILAEPLWTKILLERAEVNNNSSSSFGYASFGERSNNSLSDKLQF